MDIQKITRNPELLFTIAGVAVAVIALLYESSKQTATTSASGTTSDGSSGAVTASDLTSQVNTYNNDAAGVAETQTTSLGSVATSAISALGTIGISEQQNQAQDEQTLSNNELTAVNHSSDDISNIITSLSQDATQQVGYVENTAATNYQNATAASVDEYATQANALTTEYGDNDSLQLGQQEITQSGVSNSENNALEAYLAGLSASVSEFGTTGDSSSTEISSLATEASNEAQANAEEQDALVNAISAPFTAAGAAIGVSQGGGILTGLKSIFGNTGGGSAGTNVVTLTPPAGAVGGQPVQVSGSDTQNVA